jgi:DNA-binding transcriptional MerR regulator
MRQLKYIENECFFKELQALKEFKISHYCDVYDIANLIEDCNMGVHIQEIKDFLDLFELPEVNSLIYTDDYIFVFNVDTMSDLFRIIVASIKKGISKMNDDNNPLKLKALQEVNKQLLRQLEEYKTYFQIPKYAVNNLEEGTYQESCPIQVSNNKSSNISINSFNLFKW